MNPKGRFWILASLPLVIIGLILAIRIARLHGHYFIYQRPSAIVTQGTAAQLAPWQKGEFTNIRSSPVTSAINVAIDGQTNLSVQQSEQLKESASGFFTAYSDGTFQSYLGFKTNGLSAQIDFSGPNQGLLTALMKSRTNLPPLPDEPHAKLEKVWEIVTGALTNNGQGPVLTEVDPSSIKILTASDATEGNLWILINAEQQSTWTTNIDNHITNRVALKLSPSFAPNTLIKYDQTPRQIVKDGGGFLGVMLKINARTSRSDFASPIYFAFYWSDRTKHWYPWAFGKYPVAGFNVLF